MTADFTSMSDSMTCSTLRRRLAHSLLLPAALLVVGGIGVADITGSCEAFAQSSSGRNTPQLQKAVFAKGLTKNQEPTNPSSDFFPSETICLSLKFKGRPSKGIASAKFYLGDHLISEAKIDVASVNSGVLFSIGSSTFAGFSLKPTSMLPISDKYRVDTFYDAKPIGTYKFRVVPPVDAIPTKILEATLAKGVTKDRTPVEPMTSFTASQPVYLTLRGDLGSGTGVEINWYVNGKLDEKGTKSLTASKNMANTRFYFAFLPMGGWKPGKQEAVLIVNGSEAGRYVFTTR